MKKRLLPRVGLATMVAAMTTTLGFAVLAAACGEDGKGAHELVIELRAGENAPSGFGFDPGDALKGSVVSVELSGNGSAEPAQLSGTPDDTGRLAFMVEEGSYEIFVSVETTDPLCVWIGSSAVTVSATPTIITLDDMLVACQ